MNVITDAIALVGLRRLAKACGVTYQAVRRWEQQGRLPRKELTGETCYAARIARISRGRIKRHILLDHTRRAWRRRST